MFNPLDDFATYNNVDAAMQSLSVISRNVQAIATGAADYSRKSLEQGAEALEQILGAPSIESAVAAQSDYLKTAYESFIAESNRMSELCADLAKEVYKPFEAYMNLPPLPYTQGLSS